jgi:hypothetical protein
VCAHRGHAVAYSGWDGRSALNIPSPSSASPRLGWRSPVSPQHPGMLVQAPEMAAALRQSRGCRAPRNRRPASQATRAAWTTYGSAMALGNGRSSGAPGIAPTRAPMPTLETRPNDIRGGADRDDRNRGEHHGVCSGATRLPVLPADVPVTRYGPTASAFSGPLRIAPTKPASPKPRKHHRHRFEHSRRPKTRPDAST